MPAVSVIIPTYNRSDTILRAVRGVQAQTFQDLEIILVDDGSTDNTLDMIKDIDPRLKIFRQGRQGASAARNTGIRKSSGKYIAMLDSDDEWYPLYLEACVAFLESHPDENVVQTEYEWNKGKTPYEIFPITDIVQLFVPLAQKICSTELDLPAGETDDYLRIYQQRLGVESWGENILAKMPNSRLYNYKGNIFNYWRWGYMMTVWSTVLTRRAFDKVGVFDTLLKSANDFHFLTKLSREYPVNLLSFPGCIKHEVSDKGFPTTEEHLASGKNTLRFELSWLKQYDELFFQNNSGDRITKLIRARRLLWISHAALWEHQGKIALQYAEEALLSDPNFLRARIIRNLLKYIPNFHLAGSIYSLLVFLEQRIRQLFRG
jgi:glycosyltransferase involved in cell wall biosynthesis